MTRDLLRDAALAIAFLAVTGAWSAIYSQAQFHTNWRDMTQGARNFWIDVAARGVLTLADAEVADAVSEAQAEVERLREVEAGIRALHFKTGIIEDGKPVDWCKADGREWPCPTIALLASDSTCAHKVSTYTDGETIFECGQPATHEILDLTGTWAPVCDAHGRGLGVSEDRLRALLAPLPAATTGEADGPNAFAVRFGAGIGEPARCDQCGGLPGECVNQDTGEEWGSCYNPRPAPVSSGEAGTGEACSHLRQYFCPQAGENECPDCGGFDACCDKPELHTSPGSSGEVDCAEGVDLHPSMTHAEWLSGEADPS